MLKRKSFSAVILALFITGCQTLTVIQENKSINSKFNDLDAFIQANILNETDLDIYKDKITYNYSFHDLNNNGKYELMIVLKSSWFCGSGGCSTYLFNDKGEPLSDNILTTTPILTTQNKTNGYKDIVLWNNGGYKLMKFTGKQYPSNPTIETENYDLRVEKAIDKIKNTSIFQQDGYDLKNISYNKILKPINIHQFSFKHYGDPEFSYLATYNDLENNVSIEKINLK